MHLTGTRKEGLQDVDEESSVSQYCQRNSNQMNDNNC
jgi:hypothetical protein